MKYYSQLLFFLIFFSINSNITAQKPYFQQEVNYTIEVKLNDNKHELSAFESIVYTNNSPDTLEFLYFHLWPNAYKNNKTAFARQSVENGSTKFYYSSPEEKGYIDSLDFKVNGEKTRWIFDIENIDICKLILNKPLNPGENITITTPFYVKIPGNFSRLGHVDQSYQITQWYPKPAVYDNNGWHAIPYLDLGEFYSEFGAFDVSITLPKNYVVGATGELQTRSEKNWLDSIARITANTKSFEEKKPISDSTFKTIRYTEKNVHDFAWFANKSYYVLKDSVQLPNTNNWVTCWAMFTSKDSKYWLNAPEYINDAVYYYSKWYGNYPYKNCSAVRCAIEAGGAMEYPEITVVGSAGNNFVLEDMIMHEVGHNWFYGILGFNERDYPYLDEGINTFSEFRYMNEKYHKEKKVYEMSFPLKMAEIINIDDIPFGSFYEISSLIPQRFNVDQPMNTGSTELTSLNYGSIVYDKSAMVFYYLLNSLGEEKFNAVMQDFFQNWKFKHPQPKDFQKAFEDASSADLSWIFDDLISTTKKVDYKAVRVKNNKILIKNTGQIVAPVSITGYSKNELQYTLWQEGFNKSKWIDLPENQITNLVVNAHEMPEFHRKDNSIKTSGLLKKVEPLEISLFQILEKSYKTQLGILPAMGWNHYNGYMLGAMFYSPVLPIQRFDYQLIPMYAFGNNDFAGMGKLTLHTLPAIGFTNRIDYSLSGLQFAGSSGNFYKIRAELSVFLKKKVARSPVSQVIEISATIITENDSYQNGRYDFYNLRYLFSNNNVLNPYNFVINTEIANNSPRLTTSLNYAHATAYSEKAITLKLFAGYIFDYYLNYPFYLSGGAKNDYQYDEIYPGRYEQYAGESIFGNQFSENQGGFAIYTPYYSSEWLTTAQLKIKIPKTPVNFYSSIGTYSGAGDDIIIDMESFSTNKIVYETGLNIDLGSIINIYFPLFVSSDIDTYLSDITQNYWQKIRFTMDLNKVNVFKLRDKIAE